MATSETTKQPTISAAKQREKKIVRRFIEVYCREHCGTPDGQLCPDCADLAAYAQQRLEKCPFDPKPKCKDCKVHCYRGEYRTMIREVMRFSGMYFAKRGRIDWLVKYFLASR